MKPNLEKIDLPHLKADIQKYEKAGVFTDGAYSYWQRFLDGFESTYGMLPAVPVPWIVNDLPTVTPIFPTDVLSQYKFRNCINYKHNHSHRYMQVTT